VYSLLVGKK